MHVRIGASMAFLAVLTMSAGQADDRSTLAEGVTRLTRDSSWTRTATVSIGFPTFHPQGMVKIGDMLFVSSVEVRVRPRRTSRPDGGVDIDPGEGVGHLFQLDSSGKLVRSLWLGEGPIYHPGGIDYDGTSIWVPVAEYRPDSRSIVYRVDPRSMTATEVFRFADHIGALVHNTDEHTLHGVSWGSRRLYRWRLGDDGNVTNPDAPTRLENASHYVDYQDCKYAGAGRMLCSGLAEARPGPSGTGFALGGLDLVDLTDGRPRHQVPVLLWTPSGLAMTRNPVWLEPTTSGLRGYFMPEDDASTLYVYEVETK